jgi:uncharacterized membrane protein
MAAARELEDIERGLLRHTHEHPPVRNVNLEVDRRSHRWDRTAADLARVVGSWPFITVQAVLLAAWIALNSFALARHWDGYPFALLNLIVTIEIALALPLVLMALNRQADRERLTAEQHFQEGVKAEEELKAVMKHLEIQDEVMLQLVQRLDRTDRQLRRITRRLGLDEDAQ